MKRNQAQGGCQNVFVDHLIQYETAGKRGFLLKRNGRTDGRTDGGSNGLSLL